MKANGLSEGDEVAAAIEDSIREAEQEVNMNEKKQEEQKKQEEEKKKEEELQRQNEEVRRAKGQAVCVALSLDSRHFFRVMMFSPVFHLLDAVAVFHFFLDVSLFDFLHL